LVTIRCGDITFQNIQAVLFDKDGTLANVETFLRSLGQRRSRLIDAQVPGVQEPLLLAFGIESHYLNPKGLLAVGTRWQTEIAAAAYVAETGRGWIEALDLVHQAFIEADKGMHKAEQTPLFEGAFDLIQTLVAAKVRLGILSSDTSDNVKNFASKYQLDSSIQLLLGTDGQIAKTDPALMQQACALLKVDPHNTLLIGDSQADIQLAHQAGAAGCIAVTWGWSSHLHLTGADAVINRFNQIQVIP